MATGDEGSVTRWLDGLRAGDLAAAQRLWDRYPPVALFISHSVRDLR